MALRGRAGLLQGRLRRNPARYRRIRRCAMGTQLLGQARVPVDHDLRLMARDRTYSGMVFLLKRNGLPGHEIARFR